MTGHTHRPMGGEHFPAHQSRFGPMPAQRAPPLIGSPAPWPSSGGSPGSVLAHDGRRPAQCAHLA